MTSRREVLKLGGTLGAFSLVGMKGAPLTVPPPITTSQLAPQNTPVPYAGVFRRPPVLEPYETGFDDGAPNRPYASTR